MSPKKKPQEDRLKRIKITVEMKREIIKKHEQGVNVGVLARTYNRSTSTICTILKNKDKINKMDASKGVSRMSTKRLSVLDDVERLLLIWINEKRLQGETISENVICDKAKLIFADLIRKTSGSSTGEKELQFKGSHGWFEKFKRRTGINSVLRYDEVAENFINGFKKLIDVEGYLPQQVFNCDETGLLWKKMPKRSYISAEENASPGHKPIKDRLTLLFCANASGDFKIKPLIVYHSETPRAFKKFNVQKSRLNVMWRSNKKAWVTRGIFIDWINEVFGPSVKKYLIKLNIPLRALLIMDSAPAHSPGLQDDILEEFNFINIQFLPPKTTPLIQPMNQQVIYNFKKLYTKALFELCFEVTEGTNLSVKEFWKDHFQIVTSLKIIEKAWEGVTEKTLNYAWKKLWPQCVSYCDPEAAPTVTEIVSLANIIGLKVDNNDIEELLKEHNQELTTEELLELHRASQKEIMKGNESEELSSSSISEMLKAWETVLSYIQKHHPYKEMAIHATNLFDYTAVTHFRKILKLRQKEISR